ncbi:SDR family NAD(P)-dependent oxidoreductase [Aestuariirhabdus litorea]|uniref:SDR family oxidoreductase n=1 Tax=Aestuariirhabdus litorea TaxID=2528527 RepID=A0A3P3VL54_9GAMM|nr:glucose 1-dehydrogenase [Aestuariirhabdus litorea]RRJ82446.1 SDR family oxidoreductase [Aestuariirhabdus litorea]RWW92608.1 glucose 1-dehydrogenase [Endozoicomonadaceae bacterium GTF-13]
MSDFQGKVVLITGAANGIGREAALQFAARGARLGISDIDQSALDACAEQIREAGAEVVAVPCDVREPDQVSRFVDAVVDRFGRLDIAINNAGVELSHAKLAEVTLEAFDTTMAVNVRGVFLCMQQQLPQMVAQGGGVILNVSSVAGLGGAPTMSHYAASKHAVIGLTKSAAVEYGKSNVRVNALCPFITQTDMLERTLALMPDREEALARLTAPAPLRRAATAHEVVSAMLMVCHPDNSYMSGAEIKVDGGYCAL